MTISASAQVITCFFLLAIFTPLLGVYIAKVFTHKEGEFFPAFLKKIENFIYTLSGIDKDKEMSAEQYLMKLLCFNFIGILSVIALLRLQWYLPLNPEHFTAPSWPLALNIAISFVTNTNLQAYSGETTLSYLSQMLSLGVQNFLSAATGLSVMVALIRGITRQTSETVGNFFVDMIRGVFYILLPLSILIAAIFVTQGVVQTFNPYPKVETVQGDTQTIPLGPVASFEAIKQLGSNGGGFFNANSAHPFENPTQLTNILQTVMILLIPIASIFTFGHMIKSKKHALMIIGTLSFMFVGALIAANIAEYSLNEAIGSYPFLEGKETRIGINNSVLWTVATTATSNGSANAAISSHSPMTGGIALYNIMLGEVIFGGVGVGLAGLIMFILLTVFLCGLMVGRSPEFLGKKVEKREIQWVVIAILSPSALILIGSFFSCLLPFTSSGVSQHGPHGLTEILYAFSSAAGNNGSSFAGFNMNTNYYLLLLSAVMLLGRLSIIVASVKIAGLLAKKHIAPPSIGAMQTHSVLFSVLLVGVILIVGALTFFPPLSLGPILEQMLMARGETF